MITLRRAHERHHDRSRDRESWLTFFPETLASPLANGFGTLEALDEAWLPPGGRDKDHPPRDSQVVTFVRQGALAWANSQGRSGLIQTGEFKRMTAGRRIRHQESNASTTAALHFFRIGLRPAQADLEPGHEMKRFSVAQRRDGLCVIGSPDGRRGSLLLHQDALLYSALLDRGTHVIHELTKGRSAWLHVVTGEATLGDLTLTTGDGAGLTAERAVSFTAQRPTEILLLDLSDEIRTRLAASPLGTPAAPTGLSQPKESGRGRTRRRTNGHRSRSRARGVGHRRARPLAKLAETAVLKASAPEATAGIS